MNDRQIECFLEAARNLIFTRAAEKLMLPQPAVSRYIASLEAELGVALFFRESNRKISLTRAGKAYFNVFTRTAAELSHTRLALIDAPEVLRLGINLGWSTSDYLPLVVERCKKSNPRFRLSYQCLEFHELTAALRDKRLDAVIGLENYLLYSQEFETERFTSIRRNILYSRLLPEHVGEDGVVRLHVDDLRAAFAFKSEPHPRNGHDCREPFPVVAVPEDSVVRKPLPQEFGSGAVFLLHVSEQFIAQSVHIVLPCQKLPYVRASVSTVYPPPGAGCHS